MIEIQKAHTKYYKWTLVVAFLESWVQKQAVVGRQGVYAKQLWSYAKAIIRQEVDNHIAAGVSEQLAVARVWEMFEAACRGQPLVEMTQVLLNIMWMSDDATPAEISGFMRDLEQVFVAAHRDTEYFNLEVQFRKNQVNFISFSNPRSLQWKAANGIRPQNITICHPAVPAEDPWNSEELLQMVLSLPQAEFDALHLPESIRKRGLQAPAHPGPKKETKRKRKSKSNPDYDPEGLIMDSNFWVGKADDEFH